jgi:ABC-2 type transport system permease protein
VSAVHARGPRSQAGTLATIVGSGLHFQRRAPLSWGLSLGSMCALIAAIWPSVSHALQQAIKSYPSGIKQAFGIVELNSVEKYIDAEMLSLVVPLAVGFFAIRSATRMLVGAEESGHLDALLSLPLSRRVLVAGSMTVTALLIAAILAVCWLITLGAGLIADAHISASVIGSGFANVWPISFLFAGFAVLLAGLMHRQAPVTAVAAGTLVAMYVIDLVGKISPDLRHFRFLSAFRWYGSAVQFGFNWHHAVGLTAVGLLLAVIGMELFERRDIL